MARYSETEVDAFMRRFWWIIIGCGAVLAVPIVIYGVYLDRRLDSFENALRYRNPVGQEDFPAHDVNYSSTNLVHGQTVYVPAYSHVYHQDGRPHLLTVTLSVRNTSASRDIVINSVRYFDTNGKEVKSYLEKSLRLAALATTEFLVERNDASGGSGANFLVEWVADNAVTQPIIEAVMIDTSGQQGISFARMGQVVSEVPPDPTVGDEDSVPAPTSTE